MLRHYLIAALRNLARNKLYAALNIVGLAVGFAAALLIALYVRDEFSYDRWLPGVEKTYLLTSALTLPGRDPLYSDQSPSEMARLLKLDFPQIEAIARIAPTRASFRHGETEAMEGMVWADPNFFDVVRLPLVAGDPKTALDKPDGIVLSRKMARKYFGRNNPLGETLELNRKHVMTVTAVLDDLPSNSHLDIDIVVAGRASFSDLSVLDSRATGDTDFSVTTYTYLRLPSAVAHDAVEKELVQFIERHKGGLRRNDFVAVLSLLPILDVHLAKGNFALMKPRGKAQASYAVAAVGVLIVLAASINFVNLMTARAGRRAVEVGIRKVSGARRHDLIVQFIGESLIYVLIGTVFAVALLELALPSFDAFLDRTILFDYWHDPVLILGGLTGGLVVSLLAGAYPALVLSVFRPAAVLKGGAVPTGGSGGLRQALAAVQFAILIGLLLATGIIYRQNEYALHDGMRIDKDQVLLIGDDCKNAFKDEVAKLPGVRGITCSSNVALNFGENVNGILVPDGSRVVAAVHPLDFGFFEFFGLHPLVGRFFARDYAGDAVGPDEKLPLHAPLVINEAAVQKFKFVSPEAAIGKTVSMGLVGGEIPLQIIGVVPDFAVDSVHEAVMPTIFYVDPKLSQTMSVKLSGQDISETLTAIDRLWGTLGEPRPNQRFFLDRYIQSLYLDISRQAALFSAFAIVAVFIACLGLFGLSAFTAERRTKEIGIRKAMGANRFDIVKLLVWQFTKPVLWANLIAWPVGYYVMNRWLNGFAYHVGLEPWIFVAAAALALAIALITVSAHAFRVASARPVGALRYE